PFYRFFMALNRHYTPSQNAFCDITNPRFNTARFNKRKQKRQSKKDQNPENTNPGQKTGVCH
ncbi:hypothetical protein, partial [Alishewanella sp. WH16-1]|uniref:hypothetical protein n=1 Tax=Alishewanella sp. WH16-1 TaxID=1651088 RepID=UPI001E580CC1